MSHINYYDQEEPKHNEVNSEMAKWSIPSTVTTTTSIDTTKKVEPHGGPSSYYDLPFSRWVTVNDMMEYLAEHKWGKFGIHLKDIFKGVCRWGDKEGTTVEYDTKKIIYYGCRILMMVSGKQGLRTYLHSILNDPQFK